MKFHEALAFLFDGNQRKSLGNRDAKVTRKQRDSA